MAGKLSRRDFIKMAGTAAAGVGLTACAPQVVTVVETAVVEKVVEKEGETVVITATPPPAERPTIVYWYEAENHAVEYDARVQEINDKFNVDWKFELYAGGSGTTSAKLQTALMAGFGFPDIYEGNGDTYPAYLRAAEEIPFMPLNDFFDVSPYANDVLEARWSRYTKAGKKYGAPHDAHAILLLYHDAAWKEYGVDLSTVVTWDDYLAACETVGKDAVTADGQKRIHLYDDFTYGPIHKCHMMEHEIWWMDKNYQSMLLDPRMKESVESEIRFKDYLTSIDWGNGPAQFKAGQAMSYLAPDWMLGIHYQASKDDAEFMANSPMRLTPIPDIKVGGNASGTWGGSAAAVLNGSQHKAEAANAMLYLYFDNTEHQLAKRWKDMGILAPVMSAWEEPGFHEPWEYLGGQSAGTMFIEAVKKHPPLYEDYKTSAIANAYSEQIALVIGGSKSVDQALADAEGKAQEEMAKMD